ncbi:MAG TPA: GAF domain-containing protein [Candidatus Limnocylindrales bacterium]|nr:GAF domain-containing protein [Candidatus Limnocylindrales bacterium]
MDIDLRRLVTRHRHVAPMLSALLAGTDARVVVTDAEGEVILHREGSGPAGAIASERQRYPILLEGAPVGWVDGGRIAAAVAAVLGYAAAREHDKRSLAQEALERYRELNLIYDLAGEIGTTLEVAAVAAVAVREAGRLPAGGTGFLLLRTARGGLEPSGDDADLPPGVAGARAGAGILGAVLDGEAEIVNDVAGDPRSTEAERGAASLVAAPLKVRGERIGVVGAASAEPIEYRAADLKVLSAIAALTAPTIDQARAHEAVLRTAGRG